VKTVLLAILFAAGAELKIWQNASLDYSGSLDGGLAVVAILLSVLLGFNAPNGTMAFLGSAAASAPGISYSMIGYGLLEMGGILHALSFGGIGLACYIVVQKHQNRRRLPETAMHST
jgi:hypothetical protein